MRPTEQRPATPNIAAYRDNLSINRIRSKEDSVIDLEPTLLDLWKRLRSSSTIVQVRQIREEFVALLPDAEELDHTRPDQLAVRSLYTYLDVQTRIAVGDLALALRREQAQIENDLLGLLASIRDSATATTDQRAWFAELDERIDALEDGNEQFLLRRLHDYARGYLARAEARQTQRKPAPRSRKPPTPSREPGRSMTPPPIRRPSRDIDFGR
ncbi:hypothetical protein ACTD5D_19370 [Nocardia takedensis]|uniref:hypothetical protein n=1 Tax=Nocardia takedensis TaxID=259390 RepID=UPI003F75DEB4